MAELKEDIVRRLDEISDKLNGMGDTFNNLIASIDKLSENMGNLMEGLMKQIRDYSVMITQKGQEDFDAQRNQLISINEQFNKFREGIGMGKMMKMSEALKGILQIFGETDFNPQELENKISEITKFIESKKG